MIRKTYIVLILLLSCSSFLLASENITVEKLSKDTYVVLPKPEGKSFSNSLFIILEDGVFVIDSQASKELAQEVLREIKKITPKPVKYLVNTHHHLDHIGGNAAFFPDAQIILHHTATSKLKEDKALVQYPIISIKYDLSILYKNKEIQIIWLGKGHTDGDLFIYIPKDRILVLGDLFFNQIIPYVKDGNIGQWIAVLNRILKLYISDVDIVVPGHGPVSDITELKRFRELLAWSRGVVESELEKGTEKEKIIESAKETKLYKTRIIQYEHQERLPDLINKVYREYTKYRGDATPQE